MWHFVKEKNKKELFKEQKSYRKPWSVLENGAGLGGTANNRVLQNKKSRPLPRCHRQPNAKP